MTKIYDLVHLNNQMYMVDKEAEKQGYVIYADNQIYYLYGSGIWTKSRFEEGAKLLHTFSNDIAYTKIIATTDSSLNLSLLPQIEKSIHDQMLDEYPDFIYLSSEKFNEALTNYTAAKAKKYTKEDMFAFGTMCGIEKLRTSDQVKEALKLFNPLPKQVEVFIEKHNIGGGFGLAHNQPLQSIEKPMVSYPQNIVQIKRWIYEDNN